MGLDITAYSRVVHIDTVDADTYHEKYWTSETRDSTAYVYPNPPFADAAVGLVQSGVYRVDGEVYRFRAGSYGGYNEWRGWLSWTFLGVGPEMVWGYPDAFAERPFYRLINFSDCEGYIDAAHAASLAADFADGQTRAEESASKNPDGDWFIQKYADWRKAFDLAADGGFVGFR